MDARGYIAGQAGVSCSGPRRPSRGRQILALVVTAIAAACAYFHGSIAQAATTSPPQRLRDTGLFAGDSTTAIAAGILAFSPQYPLWSGGAEKRRWIALPTGTYIDAARADAWEFPRGTRLWKEFSAAGRRLETRFIERLDDGSWRYATYVWNEAGTEAVLAPKEGAVLEAGERSYNVPGEPACHACHEGAAAPVLGFSALQLSSDRDPLAPHAEPAQTVDLRALVSRGWIRNLPPDLLRKPPRIAASSPIERAALGYLHGNCGHCHGKPDGAGASVPVGVLLAQSVVEPNSAAAVLRSLVGAPSRFRPAGAQRSAQIVVPGASHASMLPVRMRSRDALVQMPPLGTDTPDLEAIALIERWIDNGLQTPRR
jgi:hypothetical protein